MTPFGHHVLRNRYRFEGDLELVSALRLSSGRASDETDGPLMRTREGKPFIPGSSLRGALRSELERVIPVAGKDRPRSCTLFAADESPEACPTVSQRKKKEIRELVEGRDEGETREDREAKVAHYLEERLCDLCKLFGSPYYASRLVIEDSFPVAQVSLPTAVRDGFGIDRDTGTAREGIKFNYEVLEVPKGGLRFRLRMQVENLTDMDRQLLNVLVYLLKEGLHVGGKRAAGLGRIKLVEGSLKVRSFDSEAFWKAVEENRDPYGPPRSWQEVGDAQTPAL